MVFLPPPSADAELGIGAVVIALGALGDGKVGLLASAAVGQSIKFAFESIGPQVCTCDGIMMEFGIYFGEYFQTINVSNHALLGSTDAR